MTLIPITLEIQKLLAAYFNVPERPMSDYYSDLYAAYHQECKSPSDGSIVTFLKSKYYPFLDMKLIFKICRNTQYNLLTIKKFEIL